MDSRTPAGMDLIRGSLLQQQDGRMQALRQHSTAQHNTVQHGTARHSTAQHGTAQHSTAQHSTARHSTSPHSTARHSTLKDFKAVQQQLTTHKLASARNCDHCNLDLQLSQVEISGPPNRVCTRLLLTWASSAGIGAAGSLLFLLAQ